VIGAGAAEAGGIVVAEVVGLFGGNGRVTLRLAELAFGPDDAPDGETERRGERRVSIADSPAPARGVQVSSVVATS
jgi:hypothetical protein